MKNIISIILGCILIVFSLGGCALVLEKRPPIQGPPLVLIDENSVPQFADDLDVESLLTAINASLNYFNRLNETAVITFGEDPYTVKELKETLLLFKSIVTSSETDDIKQQKIIETFNIYKAAGFDDKGTVLFTGYYELVLDGSLEKTDRYQYPIYRTPDNLNYSREAIDNDGVLLGKNLEMAWLSDPIERFYLHIQGSGRIRLPNDSYIRVSYAGNNGRPYRSISVYLLENHKITKNHMSHQMIKFYLRQHPEELDKIFNYNERYIFFRPVSGGPVGALELVVQSGRTIATDPKMFPRGALAFIKLKKSLFDINKGIIGRQTFSRFVLNQDAGSAIKGPGRVDLFCGAGEWGEAFAGSLKENGELYFLVKKKKE